MSRSFRIGLITAAVLVVLAVLAWFLQPRMFPRQRDPTSVPDPATPISPVR